MEINKVQWRMIAKGAKLPCDSFLMRKDGTMTSMVTGAGVTVGQDAYYLPVEELRSFPKEESEEERIRKEISTYLKSVVANKGYGDSIIESWIAWLEKQSEQNPIDMVEPKFKVGNKIKLAIEPKYPAKEIIAIQNGAYYFDEVVYLPFNRQDEWELVEQQPAWNEEDEKILKDIITDVKYEGYNNDMQANSYKKTNWLKKIKDRVQPQSRWKPSDEQIEYLAKAIVTLGDEGDCKTSSILNDLRIELKKLREE